MASRLSVTIAPGSASGRLSVQTPGGGGSLDASMDSARDDDDQSMPLSDRKSLVTPRPRLTVGVSDVGGTPLRRSHSHARQGFAAGVGYGLQVDPDSPARKLDEKLRKSGRWSQSSGAVTAEGSSEGGRRMSVAQRSAAVAATDPLPAAAQRLLSIPPAQRDAAIIAELVKVTSGLAEAFFGPLSEDQHTNLARAWRYQFFRSGEDVVMAQESCAYLFIVLQGECEVSERQVHHLEGRTGTEGYRRQVIARRGKSFGHYPLVQGLPTYDYSAVVRDGAGCCMLLVPKAVYAAQLKREAEKALADTVSLLKANATFAPWSVHALSRLFFWFSRRKYASGEDIVRQGDLADYCFIIRTGACEVLVAPPDAVAAAQSPLTPRSPGESSPRRKRLSSSGTREKRRSFLDSGGGGSSFMRSPSDGGSFRIKSPPTCSPSKPPSPLARLRSAGRAVILAAQLRHVVTLQPGAIVGEIALVGGGESKRTATVRPAAGCDSVEVLLLDKKSFLDLDPSTLSIIGEEARYRTACTKNPDERTHADMEMLMKRTAHLHSLASREERVHYELCRHMVYRKLPADTLLVAKKASALPSSPSLGPSPPRPPLAPPLSSPSLAPSPLLALPWPLPSMAAGERGLVPHHHERRRQRLQRRAPLRPRASQATCAEPRRALRGGRRPGQAQAAQPRRAVRRAASAARPRRSLGARRLWRRAASVAPGGLQVGGHRAHAVPARGRRRRRGGAHAGRALLLVDGGDDGGRRGGRARAGRL